MNAQQHQEGTGPATGAVIVPYYQMQEHEWTLARAFLYSLTVLTTIGKLYIFFVFVCLEYGRTLEITTFDRSILKFVVCITRLRNQKKKIMACNYDLMK